MAAKNEELARKRQEMQESAASWYVKRESDNESDGGKKKKKGGGGKRKTKESGVTIVDDGELNEEGSDIEEKKPKRKVGTRTFTVSLQCLHVSGAKLTSYLYHSVRRNRKTERVILRLAESGLSRRLMMKTNLMTGRR